MSFNSKFAFHFINDEEYVLLRDAARARYVTPKELLDFARTLGYFDCFRIVEGEYEYVPWAKVAARSFQLRNSLLIPRSFVELVPVIDANAVEKVLLSYYGALAEELAAFERCGYTCEFESTNSPEYHTYLDACSSLMESRERREWSEPFVIFVYSMSRTTSPQATLTTRLLSASIKLTEARKSSQSASLDELLGNIHGTSSRRRAQSDSQAAARAESEAYSRYLQAQKSWAEFFIGTEGLAQKYAEVLLCVISTLEAKRQYDLAIMTDWAAICAAGDKYSQAQQREQAAKEAFIRFWETSAGKEQLERRRAAIAYLFEEAAQSSADQTHLND